MTPTSDEQTEHTPGSPAEGSGTAMIAKLATAFVIGAIAAGLAMLALGQRIAPASPPAKGPSAIRSGESPALPKTAQVPPSRRWPDVSAGASKATLWTKPGDGVLMLRLALTELPEEGLDFRDDASLVIKFVDADGFAIAEHRLHAAESTTRRAADGKIESYEWLDSASVAPETYARVSEWKLVWSRADLAPATDEIELPLPAVESAAPLAPAVAVTPPATIVATPIAPPLAKQTAPDEKPRIWKDALRWKRLKPGMSQAQVILALGIPSKKTSSAVMETWYYGDIGIGGYVFFERKADSYQVKSFEAPRD